MLYQTVNSTHGRQTIPTAFRNLATSELPLSVIECVIVCCVQDGRLRCSLRAVAVAFEHAEMSAPGADGLAVLVGHDSCNLVEMSQIVGGPGGQQLRESDGSEVGMLSAAFEILRLQIPCAQFVEIRGTQAGGLTQPPCERALFSVVFFPR